MPTFHSLESRISDSPIQQINYFEFFGQFSRHKKFEEIVAITQEIQNFSHDYENHSEENFGYLLRFNAFASEKIKSLNLSEDEEKIFAKLIEKMRDNLEIEIRIFSPKNQAIAAKNSIFKKFARIFKK